MAKSANVTKFDAGGSGDNIIADGYIKTVEKVWIDSYTMSQVLTSVTIDICSLPSNKKITGIDVTINTSISQTSGSVCIGNQADGAFYFGNLTGAGDICHNLTVTSIKLPGGGAIGGAVAIGAWTPDHGSLHNVTNGTTGVLTVTLRNWVASTGTVKTVVRYT